MVRSINNKDMKQCNFKELRSLARDRGVYHWYHLNKKQLCEALSLTPPSRFSLTCVRTSEVTMWENSCSISKAFKTNPGCVFYAIKAGRPLKAGIERYNVQQLF